MKAFDLKAAQRGAKVVTRDGRAARILAFDMKCKVYPLVVVVHNYKSVDSADDESVRSYTEQGQLERYNSSGEDLVMALTKHVAWLNVYSPHSSEPCYHYTTELAADNAAGSCRTACIKIEWEA